MARAPSSPPSVPTPAASMSAPSSSSLRPSARPQVQSSVSATVPSSPHIISKGHSLHVSSSASDASHHVRARGPGALGHVKIEGGSSGERIFPLRSVLHFHAARSADGSHRGSSAIRSASSGAGTDAGTGTGSRDSGSADPGSSLNLDGSVSGLGTPSGPVTSLHSSDAFARLTRSPLRDDNASHDASPSSYAGTRSDGEPTARPEGTVYTTRTIDFPMTVRFKHEVAADGENLVLTGWQGSLEKCEDEPIHCPGAVQAYGVLIAFDEDKDGNFVVAQVSENCSLILGITPSSMFRAKCLTDFFSESEAEDLRDAIDMLSERDNDDVDLADLAPVSFDLSGRGSRGTGTSGPSSQRSWRAYCAMYRPNRKKQPNRAVLELELFDDFPVRVVAPSAPAPTVFRSAFDDPDLLDNTGSNDTRPGMPSDQVMQPTEEDLFESTVSLVQPLKEMVRLKKQRERQRAQKAKSDHQDTAADLKNHRILPTELHIVQLLSQVDEQFQKADDLSKFLKITAGLFRELTEFDRAMVYQFDENWDGQVVAEQVDWTKTKDLFRGLHFPAGDIPAQAREMYKLNKVRLLFDRDQPTARLCCRTMEEIENPLDMTHSFLRAISPIHLKYLTNMGVRSSMSISIVVFGKLWGLVALHGYGEEGHRVSFPVRQLCRLLSDSIGRNIERLTYAKRLQQRTLINTTPSAENPGGYIVATAEDLLALFGADFGCLSIGDEAKILGQVDNSQELLAVLEYLRVKCYMSVQVTQDIATDFPDIDYAAGFSTIAGFLTVPLSREGKDFIVFCRKGQLEHIRWAGNPYAKSDSPGYNTLEPRKSFKVWGETVVGKCRSWTDEQMDTPQILLLIYGKFIDVWRQKESLLSATRLANLLLVDASRSVRTPLNAIISCLEVALNGSLDVETRDNISKSYAASRTLVHVINDLLDLTRTEQGKELFMREQFNLPGTIHEAVAIHAKEARRRGLAVDIVESPQGTPVTMLGDPTKVGRIISEVCSNSLKHTSAGGILIEWGELIDSNLEDAENKHDSIRIGISITDTGTGISDAQLESMFRAFEHISTINDRRDEVDDSFIGLGLARVARIVRTLGGQLRVESKVGEGSKFTFVLPFQLPSASNLPLPIRPASSNVNYTSSHETFARSNPTDSSEDEFAYNERQLARGGNARGGLTLHHGYSSDSVITSGSSVAPRSDIDAILESLATSHMDQGSGAFSTRDAGGSHIKRYAAKDSHDSGDGQLPSASRQSSLRSNSFSSNGFQIGAVMANDPSSSPILGSSSGGGGASRTAGDAVPARMRLGSGSSASSNSTRTKSRALVGSGGDAANDTERK